MNKNQYRGKNGRYEKATVEKLFGIKCNDGSKYRCLNCGDIFAPILVDGFCTKCGSQEKEKVATEPRQTAD